MVNNIVRGKENFQVQVVSKIISVFIIRRYLQSITKVITYFKYRVKLIRLF